MEKSLNTVKASLSLGVFSPFGSKCDKYTVSPWKISTWSNIQVMGIKKLITKVNLPWCLQSIYVTRDRVILKFEARVQIYMAVLNICCEIQNSDRNVVRFSKINSYGISFWLVLLKNMRNIRLLGVWWHYFQLIREFQRYFPRNLEHSVGMLKITKRN